MLLPREHPDVLLRMSYADQLQAQVCHMILSIEMKSHQKSGIFLKNLF